MEGSQNPMIGGLSEGSVDYRSIPFTPLGGTVSQPCAHVPTVPTSHDSHSQPVLICLYSL